MLTLALCLFMQGTALATLKSLGLHTESDHTEVIPTATQMTGIAPAAPPASQPIAIDPSVPPTAPSPAARPPAPTAASQPETVTVYRHEGAGYASAEAAILAYLAAREACDLSAILATFAIETYVENYNSHALLENLKLLQPTQIFYFPGSNDYMQQIQIVYRQKEIVDELAAQYIRWLWPEEDWGPYTGKAQLLREQGQIDAYYSAFDVDNTEAAEAIMLTFLGFEENVLGQLELTDVQLENYYAQLQKQQTILGCDEIVEKVAHVQQGELDAYLFMRCARYGDRWYNITSHGTLLGVYMGLAVDTAGLVFSDFPE